SGALDIIVIDSVAALVPKAEIEGEMGDHFVGLHARLMSQAMRKLTAAINRTNTCLIFINQIREKIGVMFGSPETTTGGRALKFYSSVRIDIRRIGQIKNGDLPIGARTKATVVKNKVAPPFRKVEFDIVFNQGINYRGELIDIGVDAGVIKRSGTWLSYGDQRLGQGRDRACGFLAENPETAATIRRQILEKVAPEVLPAEGGASGKSSEKPSQKVATAAGDRAAPAPTNSASRRGASPQKASASGAARGGASRGAGA
ncbi:MAG: recombinase RecA family protein, partial [Planctomycetota bacterium]